MRTFEQLQGLTSRQIGHIGEWVVGGALPRMGADRDSIEVKTDLPGKTDILCRIGTDAYRIQVKTTAHDLETDMSESDIESIKERAEDKNQIPVHARVWLELGSNDQECAYEVEFVVLSKDE